MEAKIAVAYTWSSPGSEVSDYYKYRNQLTTLPGDHTAFSDRIPFLSLLPKHTREFLTKRSEAWKFQRLVS